MFDIGWSELLLIGIVALFVIGPKQLPDALRQAGRWLRSARKVAGEFQHHVNDMMREADLEDVQKGIRQARSFSIRGQIEKAIDPKGELNRDFRAAFEPTGTAAKPAAAKPISVSAAPIPRPPLPVPGQAGAAPPAAVPNGAAAPTASESGTPAPAATPTRVAAPAAPAAPPKLKSPSAARKVVPTAAVAAPPAPPSPSAAAPAPAPDAAPVPAPPPPPAAAE